MTNVQSSAAKTSDNQVQGAAVLLRTSKQVARQTYRARSKHFDRALSPHYEDLRPRSGTPTSASAYAGLSDVDRGRVDWLCSPLLPVAIAFLLLVSKLVVSLPTTRKLSLDSEVRTLMISRCDSNIGPSMK